MPIRDFPFPLLHIGTDVCSISRITKLISQVNGAGDISYSPRVHRFLRRMFIGPEHQAFASRFHEVQPNKVIPQDELRRVSTYLAGRWAAKEAVVKACPSKALTFDHIAILTSAGSKRPYAIILDQPYNSTKRASDSQDAESHATSGTPTGGLGQNNHSNPVAISPHLEEVPLAWRDGKYARVSISHDGDVATAVCLASGDFEVRRLRGIRRQARR